MEYENIYEINHYTRGEKVRWLRKHRTKDNSKKGYMSSDVLAKEMNISSSTLNKIEKDEEINLSSIVAVADYFGVSIDWLCSLSNISAIDDKLKFVCDYTGLSESAVKTMKTLNDPLDHIFSGVPSEFTPIIDYLINDIGLKFNKDANGVITDTCRYKHDSIINALARYLYIHPEDDQSVYLTTNGKIFLDREKAFEENKGKTDINRVFIENSADLIKSVYYNNLINAIRVTKENFRGDTHGNNQETQ